MFSTNITAETTDEEMKAPIYRAREALVRAATVAFENTSDATYGEQLVNLAQKVRNAEARAQAWFSYRAYLQSPSGNTEATALMALFYLVSQNDDRWSGRGNDSIRAAHDEVVEWARNQIHNIKR